MSINSVTIVGRLTRDPEIRTTPAGLAVAQLGVAVNERRKNQTGEWEDNPSFLDVTAFGGTAENIGRFLTKGREVAVSGRLRQERWQNQAGENRSKVVIVAQDVQFIGPRDGNGQQGGQQQQAQQPPVGPGHYQPQPQANQAPNPAQYGGDFGGQPQYTQTPSPAIGQQGAQDDLPF